MLRSLTLFVLAFLEFPVAVSAPAPKGGPKAASILVFDDCDEEYRGKDKYEDNLTLIDPTGKQTFRVPGFNNCQSIGCSRMVAADPARKCVWVIENVAHRVRRFDLTGRETLVIDGIHGSAVAVDPETGNVWAMTGNGQIGQGKTVVYDPTGKLVASHAITGWDIVYDRKAKAFWIADTALTKITADGKIEFSVPVSKWCAVSLDVDPTSGSVWVAEREHPNVNGSANRVAKIDADGKELVSIDLGKKSPTRVSADHKTGGVWVANGGVSVERFSAAGKSEAEFPVQVMAVHYDAAGENLWVVTPDEVQKWTPAGKITERLKHEKKAGQAWIAALE